MVLCRPLIFRPPPSRRLTPTGHDCRNPWPRPGAAFGRSSRLLTDERFPGHMHNRCAGRGGGYAEDLRRDYCGEQKRDIDEEALPGGACRERKRG